MTLYRKRLLQAITGKGCVIVMLLLGVALMPKDQNLFFVGGVVILFTILIAFQIRSIVNYLSLDEHELITLVEWELDQ